MTALKYMFCAEGVTRDAETNSISAFNILEEINTLGFPAVVPRLTVVVASERRAEENPRVEGRLRVALGENVLFNQAFPIDYADKLINRSILSFQGLVLTAPGNLSFNMTIGDTPFPPYVLRIVHAQPNQLPIHFPPPPPPLLFDGARLRTAGDTSPQFLELLNG